MKLFVYGTLKRGHSRAGVLEGHRFLGKAQTRAKYRLYNCGSYPGLVKAENGIAIEGELWEVADACLAVLDEIEGVSSKLYRRERVELEAPHQNDEVETYFYQQSIAGLPDCGSCW